MTAHRARMAWFILGLLILSGGAPTVSSDPGDEEVVNTICQTWNSTCLLYTSPSPRDRQKSRMPSSA